MFYHKLTTTLKREKRAKQRTDIVAEQVKKMLQTSDQQLILMVRG